MRRLGIMLDGYFADMLATNLGKMSKLRGINHNNNSKFYVICESRVLEVRLILIKAHSN